MSWGVWIASTLLVSHFLLKLCERKVLMPWLARSKRGAWAENPKYWAFGRYQANPDDGDEPPQLIERDPWKKGGTSYKQRRKQR